MWEKVVFLDILKNGNFGVHQIFRNCKSICMSKRIIYNIEPCIWATQHAQEIERIFSGCLVMPAEVKKKSVSPKRPKSKILGFSQLRWAPPKGIFRKTKSAVLLGFILGKTW